MTSAVIPEPAVPAGDDPRQYARLLADVYNATMSGEKVPARPRDVIGASWERVRDVGLNPETGILDGPLDAAELEGHRVGSGLLAVLDDLTRGLDMLIADGDNILVIADAGGRVLWRSGVNRVLSKADSLGFVLGANWSEDMVGTNAIGTALASGRAVQVFSAEHFVRSHHAWTCAGAPIRDPRTDEVLGVVDVSGPAATIHPTTVALVDAVAKLAEAQLRDLHRRSLDALRSVAAPMLARMGVPALAVDAQGWVAAVDVVQPRSRLVLPKKLSAGRVWLSSLGACDVDPLPGGWLVRVAEDAVATEPTRIELTPGKTEVWVTGPSGRRQIKPSRRHADILALLARHRDGLTAAQMADKLFGDPTRTITVRAEMSRLRKSLGGLLDANPYRFSSGIDVVWGGAAADGPRAPMP
ncbi:GAF domain-containing protein [Gordonia sp. TBRC 11910]|uniref:GAF domain-containing protein n=1 Tax=Gordonia asplenii TaxID=2725283 RepID=A0A848L1D2_9ACTN|nr:helix-turn-helix domain-containing protein [Gordonia asplenii]NMO04267.1 GAF domain-containing protein [Gordonia asplenii]